MVHPLQSAATAYGWTTVAERVAQCNPSRLGGDNAMGTGAPQPRLRAAASDGGQTTALVCLSFNSAFRNRSAERRAKYWHSVRASLEGSLAAQPLLLLLSNAAGLRSNSFWCCSDLKTMDYLLSVSALLTGHRALRHTGAQWMVLFNSRQSARVFSRVVRRFPH